jgi:hypothetical protein
MADSHNESPSKDTAADESVDTMVNPGQTVPVSGADNGGAGPLTNKNVLSLHEAHARSPEDPERVEEVLERSEGEPLPPAAQEVLLAQAEADATTAAPSSQPTSSGAETAAGSTGGAAGASAMGAANIGWLAAAAVGIGAAAAGGGGGGGSSTATGSSEPSFTLSETDTTGEYLLTGTATMTESGSSLVFEGTDGKTQTIPKTSDLLVDGALTASASDADGKTIGGTGQLTITGVGPEFSNGNGFDFSGISTQLATADAELAATASPTAGTYKLGNVDFTVSGFGLLDLSELTDAELDEGASSFSVASGATLKLNIGQAEALAANGPITGEGDVTIIAGNTDGKSEDIDATVKIRVNGGSVTFDIADDGSTEDTVVLGQNSALELGGGTLEVSDGQLDVSALDNSDAFQGVDNVVVNSGLVLTANQALGLKTIESNTDGSGIDVQVSSKEDLNALEQRAAEQVLRGKAQINLKKAVDAKDVADSDLSDAKNNIEESILRELSLSDAASEFADEPAAGEGNYALFGVAGAFFSPANSASFKVTDPDAVSFLIQNAQYITATGGLTVEQAAAIDEKADAPGGEAVPFQFSVTDTLAGVTATDAAEVLALSQDGYVLEDTIDSLDG